MGQSVCLVVHHTPHSSFQRFGWQMGLGFGTKGRSSAMEKNASVQKTRKTGLCEANTTPNQRSTRTGVTLRPKTPSINGLVGHLTQSLNHDCSTNSLWVHALTVLRPRWMGTPSATPAGEYWPTVQSWSNASICKKIVTTTSLRTGWHLHLNEEVSCKPTEVEQRTSSKVEKTDSAVLSCLDWWLSSCFRHKQERWRWVKFLKWRILLWIRHPAIWSTI